MGEKKEENSVYGSWQRTGSGSEERSTWNGTRKIYVTRKKEKKTEMCGFKNKRTYIKLDRRRNRNKKGKWNKVRKVKKMYEFQTNRFQSIFTRIT